MDRRKLTEGTALFRQVAEVHLEGDANAVRVGDGRYRALDVAAGVARAEECLLGQHGLVGHSGRVVLNHSRVAKLLWWIWVLVHIPERRREK